MKQISKYVNILTDETKKIRNLHELKSVIVTSIIMSILCEKANVVVCLLDTVHKGFPRGEN
ncbi:hypothetical protein PROSTU_01429 [Providencia stuartii ATCC 25827]|uniref:Uncharacterized protein n=1 Tax=Providencia stuartii ATCC 25827 TaxID=471874 RepID=A0AA86YN35_PROST|nr:hypothetical protein PROSTU_01429 [Providencia stuartii ATCC 25827]